MLKSNQEGYRTLRWIRKKSDQVCIWQWPMKRCRRTFMVASFHLAIQDEERVKGLHFSMKILQSLDNDVKALLQPAQGGMKRF